MLERKVLVLKPICLERIELGARLGGIVRIEKDDSVCSIHLSLVNAFTSCGEYLCCVVDSSKKTFFFNLGARPSSFNKVLEPPPNLSRGFAVGIAVVKDFIPLTVAFSCQKELNFTLTDMNRVFADRCISKRKQENLAEKIPPAPTLEEQRLIAYNDEAVATENYYQIEQEPIYPKCDCDFKESQNQDVSSEDDEFNSHRQEQTQKGKKSHSCDKDETSAIRCEKPFGEHAFYHSVKRELDDLFSKFPKENCLNGYFSDSTFVRVYYSGEKYYVVGLVKEDDKPKYICYGVPGTYAPEPPKELKGYCSFIPLSVFDLFGKGFWMMFQSAIDGRCIKKI